jgi:hypothetical protein
MRRRLLTACIAFPLLPLLLAGCVRTVTINGQPQGKSNVNAVDAQILRALQGRDLTLFTSQFPETKAPDKKLVDSRFDLASTSAQQGDPNTYVVLIHRKSHEIWIQRTGPDGVQTFGPAVMQSSNP